MKWKPSGRAGIEDRRGEEPYLPPMPKDSIFYNVPATSNEWRIEARRKEILDAYREDREPRFDDDAAGGGIVGTAGVGPIDSDVEAYRRRNARERAERGTMQHLTGDGGNMATLEELLGKFKDRVSFAGEGQPERRVYGPPMPDSSSGSNEQADNVAQYVGDFEPIDDPGQVSMRFLPPGGNSEHGDEFLIPKSHLGVPAARSAAAKMIAGQEGGLTPEERHAQLTTPKAMLQYLGTDANGRSTYRGAKPDPKHPVPGSERPPGVPYYVGAVGPENNAQLQKSLKERGYGILPGPSPEEELMRGIEHDRLAAAEAKLAAIPTAADHVRALRAESAKRQPNYRALAATPFSRR